LATKVDITLTSLPQLAESLMLTLTSVPWPFLSEGRQRHRLFFVSRMSTSGPPMTRSFGSATLVPDARWPAFAIADALFLARSIRQTVLFCVSRTYGAPSDPWTSVVSLTGLSAGKLNTSLDRTKTTPASRFRPAVTSSRTGAISAAG
jgi:hypothetical protein